MGMGIVRIAVELDLQVLQQLMHRYYFEADGKTGVHLRRGQQGDEKQDEHSHAPRVTRSSVLPSISLCWR